MGFQEGPQLAQYDAERRKFLVWLYAWSMLYFSLAMRDLNSNWEWSRPNLDFFTTLFYFIEKLEIWYRRTYGIEYGIECPSIGRWIYRELYFMQPWGLASVIADLRVILDLYESVRSQAGKLQRPGVHTEKYLRNIIKSNQNQIVFTMHRLI